MQTESFQHLCRQPVKAGIDLVEERVLRITRVERVVLDEAKHHLARVELRRVRRQEDDGDVSRGEPCIELEHHERRLVNDNDCSTREQ